MTEISKEEENGVIDELPNQLKKDHEELAKKGPGHICNDLKCIICKRETPKTIDEMCEDCNILFQSILSSPSKKHRKMCLMSFLKKAGVVLESAD